MDDPPGSGAAAPYDGQDVFHQGDCAMSVAFIGLDLAKSVFHVHGVDAQGKVVVTKRLRRDAVMAFFGVLASRSVLLSFPLRLLLMFNRLRHGQRVGMLLARWSINAHCRRKTAPGREYKMDDALTAPPVREHVHQPFRSDVCRDGMIRKEGDT
jgi:hypothetical protein